MNYRLHIVLTSIGISLIGMTLTAFAQSSNPLRSLTEPASTVEVTEPPLNHHQDNALIEAAKRAGMSPEVYEAAFPRRSAETTALPASDLPTSPARRETAIVDSNVRPAVHLAGPVPMTQPKPDSTMIGNLLNSLNNPSTSKPQLAGKASFADVIERANSASDSPEKLAGEQVESMDVNEISNQPTEGRAKSAKFDQERFQRLLKQLATNTCLVMFVGVGFILVAKRWVKGGKPGNRKDDLAIEIKSTLKLSPKSNLYLVQAGEQRLIVANDQNGIKSVVPLTESFANTLESITEMSNDLDPEPEPKTKPTPGVSVSFSDSLLAMARKTTDTARSVEVTADRTGVPEAEDDVRRKMEAALSDHGLKELILQKLRSQG